MFSKKFDQSWPSLEKSIFGPLWTNPSDANGCSWRLVTTERKSPEHVLPTRWLINLFISREICFSSCRRSEGHIRHILHGRDRDVDARQSSKEFAKYYTKCFDTRKSFPFSWHTIIPKLPNVCFSSQLFYIWTLSPYLFFAVIFLSWLIAWVACKGLCPAVTCAVLSQRVACVEFMRPPTFWPFQSLSTSC